MWITNWWGRSKDIARVGSNFTPFNVEDQSVKPCLHENMPFLEDNNGYNDTLSMSKWLIGYSITTDFHVLLHDGTRYYLLHL